MVLSCISCFFSVDVLVSTASASLVYIIQAVADGTPQKIEVLSACVDVQCTFQNACLWNVPVEQHLLSCPEPHAAHPPLTRSLTMFCAYV